MGLGSRLRQFFYGKDCKVGKNDCPPISNVFHILWVCLLVGAFAILAFSLQTDTLYEWANIFEWLRSFATGLVYAGACLVGGGGLGFLFSIPRQLRSNDQIPAQKITSGADKESPLQRYGGNANLERISDWLTTVLTGVGLVEIRSIISFLKRVAIFMAGGFGSRLGAEPFALCLIIYFAVIGFFIGYLWTRLCLGRLFFQADNIPSSDTPVQDWKDDNQSVTSAQPPTTQEQELDYYQIKILNTLWRLQALHFCRLDRAFTFTLLPQSDEFRAFQFAANKLMTNRLISLSPEGQYYLTKEGLRYCRNKMDLPHQARWFEHADVPEMNIKELIATIDREITGRDSK